MTRKRLFWLSLLFLAGSLVYPILFMPIIGLAALPIGVVVSGQLTLTVYFAMKQRGG